MSDYKVTDTELTSIANAIRAKTGKSAQIEFPTDFVSEIGSISGGGGNVSLLTRSEWDALTLAQKQAYGLVAIQDSITGFQRGSLVNGTDYVPINVIQSITDHASGNMTVTTNGNYKLLVIALNSEASTYSLDIAITLNGTTVSGTTLKHNSYLSSDLDRRNYRINIYDVTVDVGDIIEVILSNYSEYTAFVCALVEMPYTNLIRTRSTADAVCSGSNTQNGLVVYGTFTGSGQQQGTINMEEYDANDDVTTDNPGSGYKSAYIFWFV